MLLSKTHGSVTERMLPVALVALVGLLAFVGLGGSVSNAITGEGQGVGEQPINARGVSSGSQASLRLLAEIGRRLDPTGTVARIQATSSGALGRYLANSRFTGEFLFGHRMAGYHGPAHTAEVSAGAGDYVRATGLAPHELEVFGSVDEAADFMERAGAAHDWDPHRPIGSPARVDETMKLLESGNDRFLRDLFTTRKDRNLARAVIYRTAFPFDGAATERYVGILNDLETDAERAFAIRWGAILSEYVDKGGVYSSKTFEHAYPRTVALEKEYNVPTGTLKTGEFIRAIGSRAAFDPDRKVAARFGLKVDLPARTNFFRQVAQGNPELARIRGGLLRSNQAAFAELERGRATGDGNALQNAQKLAKTREAKLDLSDIRAQ